ncbi:MAG: response regulator [Verrucomicrobia bacterium]|nr:response regulator [Verrucomicrobiota bacterium]
MELPVITMPRSGASGRIRLLVVDDDTDIFDYFREICPPSQFIIATATDGLTAEQLALRETFNVAFVDYFMEGMNGPEAAQLLHKAQPALPVVLMSGFFAGDRAKVMEAAGASEFLVKPITAENAHAIIERLVGR